MSTVRLPRALHRQLAQRAAAWADRIAQATAIDRHREVANGARNIHLWLMIARRLGWGAGPVEGEEEIVITGDLARAIIVLGEHPWPETAADWDRMRTAAAALYTRARDACDDSEAAVQRLREARAIDFELEAAWHHFTARQPKPAQQEAA